MDPLLTPQQWIERAADEFVSDLLAGKRPDVDGACRRFREHYPDNAGGEQRLRALFGALASTDSALRRVTIRGYTIVRKIGDGGLGEVFLALEHAIGRRVALKLLRPERLDDPGMLERFARESRILASLSHPDIVRALASDPDAPTPWIAMELLDAAPLDRVIARLASDAPSSRTPGRLLGVVGEIATTHVGADAAMPPGEAERAPIEEGGGWPRLVARLVLRVAQALDSAHRVGVIHRDVKASNVLVRRDGSPVLTDFGLARSIGAKTLTGGFVGSLPYAAPELLHHGAHGADPRADVYSLGVLFHELLVCRRPFDGTIEQLQHAILRKEPGSLRGVDPSIPRPLTWIVKTAMEKEPSRRYATMGAFARDLGVFLAGGTEGAKIVARPDGIVSKTRKAARAHPVAALAVAAALVLTGVLGIEQWVRWRIHGAEQRQTAFDAAIRRIEEALGRAEVVGIAPEVHALAASTERTEDFAIRIVALLDACRAAHAFELVEPLARAAAEVARRQDDASLAERIEGRRFAALCALGRVGAALELPRMTPTCERVRALLEPAIAPLRPTDARMGRLPSLDRPWPAELDGKPGRELIVTASAGVLVVVRIGGAGEARLDTLLLPGASGRLVGVGDLDADGRDELLVEEREKQDARNVVRLAAIAMPADFGANTTLAPAPRDRTVLLSELVSCDDPLKVESVVAAELDGEPGRELVVSLYAVPFKVIVLRGVLVAGRHSFGSVTHLQAPGDGLAKSLVAEDVDHDGVDELLVGRAEHEGYDLMVYSLRRPQLAAPGATPGPSGSIALGATGSMVPLPAGPHGGAVVAALVSDTPRLAPLVARTADRATLAGGVFAIALADPTAPRLLESPRATLAAALGGMDARNAVLDRAALLRGRDGHPAVLATMVRVEPKLRVDCATPAFLLLLALEEAEEGLRVAPINTPSLLIPADDFAAADLDGDGDDECLLSCGGELFTAGLAGVRRPDATICAGVPLSYVARSALVDRVVAGPSLSEEEHRWLLFLEGRAETAVDEFMLGRFEPIARTTSPVSDLPSIARFLLDKLESKEAGRRQIAYDESDFESRYLIGIDEDGREPTDPPVSRHVAIPGDCAAHRLQVEFSIPEFGYGTRVRLGLSESAGARLEGASGMSFDVEHVLAPTRPRASRRSMTWRGRNRDGAHVARLSDLDADFKPGDRYLFTLASLPRQGLRFIELRRVGVEVSFEPDYLAVQFGAPFDDRSIQEARVETAATDPKACAAALILHRFAFDTLAGQ